MKWWLLYANISHSLCCVVGCGGDRDKQKRGPMALAAATADHLVLPVTIHVVRPQAILDDMAAALPEASVSWEHVMRSSQRGPLWTVVRP